jgi:hypothetical protein
LGFSADRFSRRNLIVAGGDIANQQLFSSASVSVSESASVSASGSGSGSESESRSAGEAGVGDWRATAWARVIPLYLMLAAASFVDNAVGAWVV